MLKFKKLFRVEIVFPVVGLGIPMAGAAFILNIWGDSTVRVIDRVVESEWLLNNVLLLPKEVIAVVVFLILLAAVMFFEMAYLLDKLRPKINCFFSQQDSGCRRQDVVTTLGTLRFKADYYRIKVTTKRTAILPRCSGNLISIERDGQIVFDGEPIILAFAPNNRPDSNVQDIRDGVPQFLDFVMITEDNKIRLYPKDMVLPGSVAWGSVLSQTGEYIFSIVVSSPSSVSEMRKIKLQWNGNWKEAVLTDVS